MEPRHAHLIRFDLKPTPTARMILENPWLFTRPSRYTQPITTYTTKDLPQKTASLSNFKVGLIFKKDFTVLFKKIKAYNQTLQWKTNVTPIIANKTRQWIQHPC